MGSKRDKTTGRRAVALPGTIGVLGLAYGATRPMDRAMSGYAHYKAARNIYDHAVKAATDVKKGTGQLLRGADRFRRIPDARTNFGRTYRYASRAGEFSKPFKRGADTLAESKRIRSAIKSVGDYSKVQSETFNKIPKALKVTSRISNYVLPAVGAVALGAAIRNRMLRNREEDALRREVRDLRDKFGYGLGLTEKKASLSKTKEDLFPQSRKGKPAPLPSSPKPGTEREWRADPKFVIESADDSLPMDKVSQSRVISGPWSLRHESKDGKSTELGHGYARQALTSGLATGVVTGALSLMKPLIFKSRGAPTLPFGAHLKNALSIGTAVAVPIATGYGLNRYMTGRRMIDVHRQDSEATDQLVNSGYTPHPDRATAIAKKINSAVSMLTQIDRAARDGIALAREAENLKNDIAKELSGLSPQEREMVLNSFSPRERDQIRRAADSLMEKRSSMKIRRAVTARKLDDIVTDEINMSNIRSGLSNVGYVTGLAGAGKALSSALSNPDITKRHKFTSSKILAPVAAAAALSHAGMSRGDSLAADASALGHAAIYAPTIRSVYNAARMKHGVVPSVGSAFITSIPALAPIAARVYKKIVDRKRGDS